MATITQSYTIAQIVRPTTRPFAVVVDGQNIADRRLVRVCLALAVWIDTRPPVSLFDVVAKLFIGRR